ncbi:MAG TPA: prephenate dehydrogenase/arogenate dehydrogenase family protein [Candidatus Obscuribacter sp.]|nr:prephenate dehydrogenase/arogenate dehydrogenase family protein [Candidatus Obscuribacter sp.]
MRKPESCAVIGYGRFGALWSSVLARDFSVRLYDVSAERQASAAPVQGVEFVTLPEALEADVIFYAVPISDFEEVLISHLPYFERMGSPKTLIDLLSVKVHPARVFERRLPKGYEAILMHPMFGPDSVERIGNDLNLSGLKLVMDSFFATPETNEFWRNYFIGRGLEVLALSADEHDRWAAESQGVTHFVGRTLDEFGLTPSPIDTAGAIKLQEIRTQVSKDSWQLFLDLQTYNPYTVPMRVRLSAAQDKIFNKLLPNRIYKDKLVVGIQGGPGSFNEEAANYYMSRTPELEYELKYLHTTENVLRALHEGRVDRGQFAMHNSIGGIVTESVDAMSRYNFEIVEEFAIKIAHALMIAPGADFAKVERIMSHPQVFRQCAGNLRAKYGRLEQVSGEGDLVDHARVAQLIASGELPATTATMGSKVLAVLNGLKIVEDNLQDLDNNFTSFLWVQRPS